MEFVGTISKVIKVDEGSFPHIDIVVESNREVKGETYTDSVVVTFPIIDGNKCRLQPACREVGTGVKVVFYPCAREYNGKYFQSLRGYACDLQGCTEKDRIYAYDKPATPTPAPTPTTTPTAEDEELPF